MPHYIPRRKRLHFSLLYAYIVDALHQQLTYETALAIASLLDAGRFDVIAEFSRDADGEPDPLTLHYRVELDAPEGDRQPLVRVHYSHLGVSDDEARMELAATLGIGIPDDISEIGGDPDAA